MENQPRFKNLPKEERMILYNGLVYQKNLIETGNPFLDISEALLKI